MTRLIILALTATALIPAGAIAQTVAPPQRWQDVPEASLRVPGQRPAPAMRVETRSVPAARAPQPRGQAPAAPMAQQVRVQGPAAPIVQNKMAARRNVGTTHIGRRHGGTAHNIGRRHGGPAHGMSRKHGGFRGHHRFPHVGRINRGFFIPPFWFGSQFHVGNWNAYGFPEPTGDRRWIRYFDDALLVDREGRVHDGRYGFDWDEYGDDWNYDRGIPEYVGNGDYRPDEEDYAYVEEEDVYADRDHDDGRERHHDEIVTYRGHPALGYVYAYPAYAWGYGGVTITETTVTTAPTVTAHKVYDYVDVAPRRRAKKRHYKPRCDCPAPSKVVRHYGEKG